MWRIRSLVFKQHILAAACCFLAGMAGFSHSVTYSNHMNESSWSVASSVFECRMMHHVPHFGEVVFRTRAGESSVFYLNGHVAKFDAGVAKVRAVTPMWRKPRIEREMGELTVKRGKRPFWMNTKQTEKLLAELDQGMQLELQRGAWYTGDNRAPIELVVSNIGFKDVYVPYLDCLAGLLPANYNQLKRTSLMFPAGFSEDLPGQVVRQLDKILALLRHDKKIGKLFIDGHTSSPGDRADNLELSKIRAEMVATYLVGQGVPEDKLMVRWHGERYPVASNGTVSGRAKNRRVTVRLQRIEEPPAKIASN